MKKKDQAPQQGSRPRKSPHRLTLNRETIQSLNEPLLAGVLGGLAQHTFTGNNADGDAFCG